VKRLLFLVPALALSACAPQALYFHETTKLAFAASYNTADSQPVSSTFGFKRRIVAVVPAQDRVSPDGTERTATNEKEALSIVSKFHVRVGRFSEGVVITNNFASGTAARVMTRSPGSAATLNALLHNEPIEVSPTTGLTRDGEPAVVAVDQRINRIMAKRFRAPSGGSSRGRIDSVPGGSTGGSGGGNSSRSGGQPRGRIDTVPGGSQGESRGVIDTVPDAPQGESRGRIDIAPGSPALPDSPSPAPADPGTSRGVIGTPGDVNKVTPKPATPAPR
jgi:hypothetical protein